LAEHVLSRWSRLKRQEPGRTASEAPQGRGAPDDVDPPPVPEDLRDLDVAAIGSDFDFARMMRDDVPADLRASVLRRLWATSPALFAPDGLDTYCEDYNDPKRTLLPAGPSTPEIT
jgi:hypothetical protein